MVVKVVGTLKSLLRIDRYTRTARTLYNLNRWINVRGDAIGAAFFSGLAGYLVYGTGAIDKPGSAPNIGFSLNMAGMYLTCTYCWPTRLVTFHSRFQRSYFVVGSVFEFIRISQYVLDF